MGALAQPTVRKMAFCRVPSWLYRNYREQVKCAHYKGQTIDWPVALELVEQFVKNTALQVVETTERLTPQEFHDEDKVNINPISR